MNRPHGSQPFYPPRQYQASPGPPQPQWQASQPPPSGPGWNSSQQRPQQQQQPPLPPAAQHPYNSNIYGPGPGAAHSPTPPQNPPDPASWGVKYNQNQQFTQYQQPKPPLPPRPPSVGSYGPSPGQQIQTSDQWPQAQGASSYAQVPQWQHDAYSHQQTQLVPPPPPPRPPEYLYLPHDAQAWPHPQYSHNPPSHYYEPNNQHSYQTGVSGAQHYQGESITDANPVVSPIEPPITYWHRPLPQTIPSDTGNRPENEVRKQTPKPKFGGPSDWEHFEPIADHRNDTTLSETPTASTQTSRQEAWHSGQCAELPHGPTGVQAAQGLQHPQPDEPLPEQRFFVSSADAVNSVALPAAPAPLSMSRTHRDPTDSRGSSQHNKESPGVTVAVPQRTGTIDSVILAWNKPVEGQTSRTADKPVLSRASSRQSSVSAFSATRPEGESGEISQQSPKQRYKSSSHVPPSTTNLDPYADLGPEYRASLSRYVTMLRKESEASSDSDKFNIFKAFADKELRLRSVLYGLDGTGTEPSNASHKNPAEHGSNAEFKDGQDGQRLGMTLTPKMPKSMPTTTDAGSRTPTFENDRKAQSPKLAVSTSPASNEDSFVVVEQPDDQIEYSPGGRPKVPKLQAVAKSPQQSISKISVATSAPVTSLPKRVLSPSENAPIVLDDYSTGGPQSPGRNAPIVLDMQEDPVTRAGNAPLGSEVASTTPLKFEPSRPVYTPFRYAEASHADLEKFVIQQPAHQAYTAMRQSADSGRILAQASTITGGTSFEGQDTFLGLIRSHTKAHPNNRPATPTNQVVKDPRTEASLALRALVPKNLPDDSPPPKLAAIGNEIEKLPDEFGFIHETVLRWDRDNRQIRHRQGQERQSRQEESERHIDALYEDNEIGYPDIATMEADFKLAETKKKYEEDQNELESFTTQVFEPVTERLQAEILQLKSQYTLAADLLDTKSDSASNFGNSSEGRVRLSQVIGVVIPLFKKVEIRHRKSYEAHFERERRRKKLELTVLLANGDVAAMKDLEQKFLTAEWLQVLHEAQERDARANELMDAFDRGTARVLGENQAYIDDLSAKLRMMDTALARDGKDLLPNTSEPEGLRDLLLQARLALAFIAADSDAILKGSNAADEILNDADYAVSNAKAQMANSPPAAYEKLKEEKQKEDAKIREDLDARLQSIAEGPAEALSLIEAIAARLGRDPEHEERLQRALEAAKMRNAAKDS